MYVNIQVSNFMFACNKATEVCIHIHICLCPCAHGYIHAWKCLYCLLECSCIPVRECIYACMHAYICTFIQHIDNVHLVERCNCLCIYMPTNRHAHYQCHIYVYICTFKQHTDNVYILFVCAHMNR